MIFLTSIFSGSLIRTVWMKPFYISLGIFFTSFCIKNIRFSGLRIFKYVVFFFIFITPLTYALRSIFFDSRTTYDGRKIANIVKNEWEKYSLENIENVGFSEWFAGNLSYNLKSRPKVFLEDKPSFYLSNSVIIDKNIINYCKKNENNKKIINFEIENHYVCFIFKK